MVDAIVSFAVERLGDFLIREAVFLGGVKKEVKWLQEELRLMRSFLKDAEQKQDADERIRVWVSKIQDIAYDTEDVIETFIFTDKETMMRTSNEPMQTSKWRMWSNYVKNCFGICTQADPYTMYGIGKEIEDIKSRVLEVTRQRESYGISNIVGAQEGTSSGASIMHDLRLTSSYADEEDFVGFEDDVKFLREKLLLREPRRCVISIVGMGGLGKTTLARKLYNNNRTQFGGHAWVCVSQEWKTRDLLERLIKSFERCTKDELEMLEKMKDYDMEQYLRELLKGCKYLVVIDDVWHIEAWESLRRALPENKKGSRIIITTRKESVAELSDHRTHVHRLRFLRPDESWALFCKKAFPNPNQNGVCPPNMKKLGEEMMAKCGGLPLAIIVLGGLLSRKQLHEWHGVNERIWREIKDGSIYIPSLLALSYKDLPHELKACFLYLGMFPEDFVINVNKLIRLWIAEEFIPQGEGMEVEEVAENYLKELTGRSLIQVVKMNWRTISTCRVHDLLRDLAISKAKELNFFHISDETTNSTTPSTEASSYRRRIAIRSGFESYMSLDHSHQRVRTLSFLNNQLLSRDNRLAVMLMKSLNSRFGFLRVLDLERIDLFGEIKLRFDEAVGKLIHLRYLEIDGTSKRSIDLPESIGNLQALQTLKVSYNCNGLGHLELCRLPRNICKLKQLRHLMGHFEAPPLSFQELTKLQCLDYVCITNWLNEKKEMDGFALNAFATLRNLKMLSVMWEEKLVGVLSVQPLLLNCRHLIELKIDGGIGNLPEEMHKFLPNLKFLNLTWSRLKQDPIPELEMLPNLLVLYLHNIGEVEIILTFTATGFPQLEVFNLHSSDVKKLKVEEGAMPRLRALTFYSESLKRSLPERFRSLPDESVLNWDWNYNLL